MAKGTEYTEGELWLWIDQERLRLTKELGQILFEQRELGRRAQKITERLAQLDEGENILEGGVDLRLVNRVTGA